MKKPVRKEIENSNVVAFERTFRGIKVTVSTTERVSSQICHVLDDQTMNSLCVSSKFQPCKKKVCRGNSFHIL